MSPRITNQSATRPVPTGARDQGGIHKASTVASGEARHGILGWFGSAQIHTSRRFRAYITVSCNAGRLYRNHFWGVFLTRISRWPDSRVDRAPSNAVLYFTFFMLPNHVGSLPAATQTQTVAKTPASETWRKYSLRGWSCLSEALSTDTSSVQFSGAARALYGRVLTYPSPILQKRSVILFETQWMPNHERSYSVIRPRGACSHY
jgi:hypothetical protein